MTDFLLPVSDRVLRLRKVAHGLHEGQTDRAGVPYFEHLDAVLLGVIVLGGSEAEQVGALFHDSVEDDRTTFDDLHAIHGLIQDEIGIVDALTKRRGEHWRDNLERVLLPYDRRPARVKAADLLHNTRYDRVAALRQIEPEKVDSRMERYRESLRAVLLHLGLLSGSEPRIFF